MNTCTTSVDANAPSFQAERWIVAQEIKSALVRLPRAFDDIRWLAPREVRVDGVLYKCTRVNAAAHAPPFRRGECVALTLEAPDE